VSVTLPTINPGLLDLEQVGLKNHGFVLSTLADVVPVVRAETRR
jgi:hypothetical protein